MSYHDYKWLVELSDGRFYELQNWGHVVNLSREHLALEPGTALVGQRVVSTKSFEDFAHYQRGSVWLKAMASAVTRTNVL